LTDSTSMAVPPRHFNSFIGAIRFVMEHLNPAFRESARIAFDGGCLRIEQITEIHATLLPADFDP
jgi:hypothetical protein